MNDLYIDWFLQLQFQVHQSATKPMSNIDRLEALFFGTHRYILKRMMNKDNSHEINDEDRHHSIIARCSSLTTIIRNLTFIDDNLFLANDHRLLDILERILKYQHDILHQNYEYSYDDQPCSHCIGIFDLDDRSADPVPTWIPLSIPVGIQTDDRSETNVSVY